MDDPEMMEAEAEGGEREVTVTIGADGALAVDGEPAADIGAALKMVMAKVKQMQAEGAGGDQAFEAGFAGVRGA